MKDQSREEQRAFNIVWNASADYAFRPEYEAYDGRGSADLYWNYIYGAVRKFYDYPLLECFFNVLKKDHDHGFYESLTWLGLENCAYEKGKKERPVLEDLRRSYAKNVLDKEDAASYYYLVEEIKTARCMKILGEVPIVKERVAWLLNDLELDESMSTEQIVLRMNEIINTYFPFNHVHNKRNLLNSMFSGKNSLQFGMPFQKFYSLRSSNYSRDFDAGEKKENKNKLRSQWRQFMDRRDQKKRENIQNLYGASILSDSQIKAIEQTLCVGTHKKCHLHFTRGEYDANKYINRVVNEKQNVVIKQSEKNRQYYQKSITRNNNSIVKLTNMIRNTMLVNFESNYRSETGKLEAGKIWRNIYLFDSKVFLRNRMDAIGNITVDIMLDASGSQMNRQEIIAAQGYIIAESLTRCQIPVRVYSFCTNSNFTIFKLFRDYFEVDKNEQIFNYHSSGCNRDGLAIRTAVHLMDDSPCEYKMLIILSDVKPIDPQGISAGESKADQYCYADAPGIDDTALEVRIGRQKGISILSVFTGLDEDIPAAKRIYGHNFVRIKSPEKFADMVCILIQNELKNL
jgi:hypothetical protein